jgi:hypothetical protein
VPELLVFILLLLLFATLGEVEFDDDIHWVDALEGPMAATPWG